MLATKFNYAQKYECNSNCLCKEFNCENKKVTKGLLIQLEVQFINKKGFGVFTKENIIKDSFICNYIGEIIQKDIAEKKINDNYSNKRENYIIKACEDYGSLSTVIYIDAEVKGNVARFFNHSCNPNIYLDIVRTDNFIPNLSFFALRDILVDEELTFCYNNRNSDDYNQSYKKCECGSEKCKIFLPS